MTFNYQKQYYSVAEVKNIVNMETKDLQKEIETLKSNLELLRTRKENKTKSKKK